jgi:uncharacterized membrane protein YbhN (UPF0104 family)
VSVAQPRRARFVLSILLALVVLALLYGLGEVDWREMLTTLASISPLSFLSALALHAGIYLARAERFRVLMPPDERPGRGALLAVTSAHNLAVYALPAKTGEATLPVYLNAVSGTRPAVALASLIVSRVLDLASLSALVALALAVLLARGAWSGPLWAAAAASAGLALASLACFALAMRPGRIVGLGELAARTLGLARTRLGARLLERAGELRVALVSAGASRRLEAAALSFVVWILIFAFYVALARGFGLAANVSALEASFGASLAVAMNLLPINSFAGLGTQEAGWVFGFGLVGVSADDAFATGVGAHLVQIFDTLLFGALGHLVMALVRRK